MENSSSPASSFAPDVRILVRLLFLPSSTEFTDDPQGFSELAALHREAIESFGPGRQQRQPEDFGIMLGSFLRSQGASATDRRAELIARLSQRLAEINGELNDLTKRRYLLSWDSGRYVSCDLLPDGSTPREEAWPFAVELAKKLGLWCFLKSQEPDSLPWFEAQLGQL